MDKILENALKSSAARTEESGIFNTRWKPGSLDRLKEESKKFGCECGRSPIGKCVGWHRLSDTGYDEMFAKWQKASQGFLTFKERDEFFKNNKVPKKKEIMK
jgi:hypothetical protein